MKLLSNFRNSKLGLKLVDKAPTIGVIVGTAAGVGAIIFAVKETPKALAAIEEGKKHIETIKEARENGETANGTEYTEEDYKKDLTIEYIHTGVKVAKAYAPTVILEVLSIALIAKSHVAMTNRNEHLAAAYATLNTAYNQYRDNVIAKYGEKEDFDMRFGVKNEEIEEEKELKNGEKKTVTKKKEVINADILNGHGRYAVEFNDMTSENFASSFDYNKSFLNGVQNQWNFEIRQRAAKNGGIGWVFLNEILTNLGLPIINEGQDIGFVYDQEFPRDIKFFNEETCVTWKKVGNKFEPVLIIDPQVDGFIRDIVFPKSKKTGKPIATKMA